MFQVPPQIHNNLLPLPRLDETSVLPSFAGTEESVPDYCSVCDEHYDRRMTHMWSESHHLHVSILNVDPYTHKEHRKELISNKIVARGEWLVCSLCEKQFRSYFAAIPHIISKDHKKKLAWLLVVDARNKAYSRVKTSSLQSVVPRIEELSEPVLQNERAHIDTKIGKLGRQIIEICDMISRSLRDIQKALGATSTDSRQTDGYCVICLEKPSEYVLLPCKHQSLCAECCTAYQARTCPVCRQIIVQSFKPIKP